LTVDFADQSDDTDGTIDSWAWDFGDGNSSTAQNPSHTYGTDGIYSVSLTVTDNDGATDEISQDVTVSSGGGGITLTATGYKVKGRHHVDLTWSGGDPGARIDIFRDDVLVATTENDGEFTENIGAVGGATYVYQVCEEGTSTCSNEATVTF
jgi:PKD repeat protein